MKNILSILSILSILFFISTMAFTQQLPIKTNEVMYDNAVRPSIEVKISPEPSAIKKAWKAFIQDNYDADVNGYGFLTNKDVLTAEGTQIGDISEKKIDLYAKIIKDGNMSKMNVYAAYGYNFFLTPTEDRQQFKGIKGLVTNFLSAFLPDYFTEIVQDSKEEVENLTDEIAEIEKDIERNKSKIESLHQENEELLTELQDTNARLIEARKMLQNDKMKLEKTKDKIAGSR